MPKCSRCHMRRKLGQEGLCKECREELTEYFQGAMCSRCDIDLTFDGFCPNDRCPFNERYQDEGPPDVQPVSPKEREYIERVILPRIAGTGGDAGS
jgi:hypothetical protein